jgi:hypothetical protein
MANKYWAAGVSGNWNSILSWSDFAIGTPAGALVPGAGDAAIFNAASGTVTATLDISPDIQTLTCTGFTGTLAFGTNTISLNSTGTVFTGATTMTVTGTPQIILTNSSATARTITPAAVTEANSISFRVTAGTGTLSLTAGGYRDLDFTDGTNPTGYAGALGNTTITIYGNFKASTGMTRSAGATTYTFAATSGTKTINTAGVTFDNPFTFNGVGGTWQLQDALTSGATRTTTLTAGTLDLNGYTLTTGLFNSNNSNVRVLAFGTGKIVVTGSSFNVNTATNFSFTGTSNIEGTYSGAVGTRVFIVGDTAGGSQAVAMNLKITAGTDIVYVYRFWGDVNFTGFAGTFDNVGFRVLYGSLTLSTGMTLVAGTNSTTFAATSGTKTITSAGKTMDYPVIFNGIGGTWACQDALTLGSTRALTMTNGTLQLKAGVTSTVGSFVTSGTNAKYLLSTTPGTAATISDASGTNTVQYLTVQDNIATGGATWNALAITNVDAGNNTGWLFSTTPSIGNEITMRLRSFTQPRRF